MKLLRFLILSLFLLLTGCAAKELLVRNADSMLEHQVTKRLPLNDRQKEQLAADIDQFLNSEKKLAAEILPVIDQINLGDPQKVEADYQQLVVFYRKVSKDFSTLLAKYMVQLTPTQQAKFFTILKDENRAYKRKTREERKEATEDAIEKFIGSLTPQQKSILASYDDYNELKRKERLSRRSELHTKFKTILESEAPKPQKEVLLLEAYVNHQDSNFQDSKALEIITKFLPTLSQEQKELFKDRVKEVKEVLRYFVQANY